MNAIARRMPARDEALILASLLVVAWCLAAAHAVIRPLFQVSDELNYLHTVQVRALSSSTPADAPCIAPPDGSTLTFPVVGGKFGFQHLSARVLLAACRAGAGGTALVVTRATLALTLPLLVLLTWWLARVVVPERGAVAPAAAMMTACQPVMATFAGGIAPDGLANAATAAALLAASQLVVNRASGWWLLPMVACAVLAVAAKDSALFLGPLALLVTAAWVWQGSWRRAAIAGAVAACSIAALIVSGLLPLLATPFPNLAKVLGEAATRPAAFAAAVTTAYGASAEVTVRSAFAGLANFGGGQLDLPATFFVVQIGVLAIGLVAFGWHVMRASGSDSRLRRFAWLCLAAVVLEAIQIPVRQMMTDSPGPIQGRWLFPVWPMIAVACAAGWATALRDGGRQALPLLAMASGLTALAALARIVEYYYAAWPRTYAWPHVFLHAAEGYEAGLSVARAMATAAIVPGSWRQGIVLASLISVLFMFLTTVLYATRPVDAKTPSCPTR